MRLPSSGSRLGTSIACVYTRGLPSGFGPLVDHPPGLADAHPFDGERLDHLDAGRDADVALDVVLQLAGDGVAIGITHLGGELDAHREAIEVPVFIRDE